MNKKMTRKDLAAELKVSYKTYQRRVKFTENLKILESKLDESIYQFICDNYKLGFRVKDIETLAILPNEDVNYIIDLVFNKNSDKDSITKIKKLKLLLKQYQKTRVSIDIPNYYLEYLDDLAQELEVTRTDLIRRILCTFAKAQEEYLMSEDNILQIELKKLKNRQVSNE